MEYMYLLVGDRKTNIVLTRIRHRFRFIGVNVGDRKTNIVLTRIRHRFRFIGVNIIQYSKLYCNTRQNKDII